MIIRNAFGVRTAGSRHAAAAAVAASHKRIAAATDASVNRGST
jgi:hypothetical protein